MYNMKQCRVYMILMFLLSWVQTYAAQYFTFIQQILKKLIMLLMSAIFLGLICIFRRK